MKIILCDVCKKKEGKTRKFCVGEYTDTVDSRTRQEIKTRDICDGCYLTLVLKFLNKNYGDANLKAINRDFIQSIDEFE